MKRIILFTVLSVFTVNISFCQLWKTYIDSAKMMEANKKPVQAADYYARAVEQLKKDSLGSKTHGVTALSLGNLYILISQDEKAEEMLNEAKTVLEKNNSPEELAEVHDNLGNLYRNTTRYDKAEQSYKEARKIRESFLGPQHPLYARSCDNIGILYQITGRYKESEELLMKARLIYEKTTGKQSREFAVNSSNLAILYSTTGRYGKAEEFMTEGNKLWATISGNESLDYAVSCNNLGRLYDQTGQYDKAETMFLAAKNIRGNILGKSNAAYASVCNNLGAMYWRMGQYVKSEQLLMEARKIYEKNKNQINYAGNCENIGNLYSTMGLFEKALLYLKECEETRKSLLGEEHPWTIVSSVNTAIIYMDMGMYDTTGNILLKAKKAYDEKIGTDYPGYAEICNNLSAVYRLTKEYAKAEQLALEARKWGEKEYGKMHPLYSEFSTNLALTYWRQQKNDLAKDIFQEMFDARKVQTEKIFSFSSEYEKLSFLQSVSQDWRLFYSFYYDRTLLEKAGQAFDLSLYHRNLVLSSIRQLNETINNNAGPEVKNKYGEWKTIKQQLAYWLVKPETEQKEEKAVLEEKANTIEKELTRLSVPFKRELQKTGSDWKMIQQNLKSGECAVEFTDFEYDTGAGQKDSTFYTALVLNKDLPEPVMIKLFEKRVLEKILLKKSINEKNTINLLYSSKELYQLIWKPLEKYLAGISKIYFAPSGLLHHISLAAIKINSNQTLTDKYQLVQLLSTASVCGDAEQQIIASDNCVLYGGIQYDADSAMLKQAATPYAANWPLTRSIYSELFEGVGFPAFQPLPGSETEILSIAKLAGDRKIPVKIFKGADANEESFKAIDGKTSPSVIHFATHAFFYPDPKKNKKFTRESWGSAFKISDNPLFRGGLVMAGAENTWMGKPVAGVEDGILTAYEVSNMYLPNTKLVVLSACQTGQGDVQGTEGVYGLQRAFKIAGVQNLVMSLWDVDDAAGSEFMQEFYKNLFADRAVSEAFRMAQKSMKTKYHNDPYLWAGFVLIR